MIDDYSKLKDELKSLYPEDYETKDYDSLFTGASGGIESAEKLIREKKGGNLLQRLKGCSPGNSDWKTFEDVCLDLVKLTFENNEFASTFILISIAYEEAIYEMVGKINK